MLILIFAFYGFAYLKNSTSNIVDTKKLETNVTLSKSYYVFIPPHNSTIQLSRYNLSSPIWVETVKVSKNNVLEKYDVYQTLVLGYIASYYNDIKGEGRWVINFYLISISSTDTDNSYLRTINKASQSINVDVEEPKYGSRSISPYYLFAYPVQEINDDGFFEKEKPVNNTLAIIALNEINNYTNSGLNITEFDKTIRLKNAGGWINPPWQYDTALNKQGCGYISYWDSGADPGAINEYNITSTLNWGLGDKSTVIMHLKLKVPPDPVGMTDDEKNEYGIYDWSQTINLSPEVTFG